MSLSGQQVDFPPGHCTVRELSKDKSECCDISKEQCVYQGLTHLNMLISKLNSNALLYKASIITIYTIIHYFKQLNSEHNGMHNIKINTFTW